MNVPGLPTNLLLSSLSTASRASLLKHAAAVELPSHTVLYEEAAVPRHAHFLLSGLASVVTTMSNGESAEVAMIGREGMAEALHLLGSAALPTRCVMQLPGSALRVPFAQAQQVFDDLPEVRRGILEFVQQQSASVAQVAGCNRIHTAEQRLIRWLLMAQDRTGYGTLNFTQEYLSQMIGTQRTTVTVIAGDLQQRGLLRYSRGKIQILNRSGLEAAVCVCEPIIRQLLENLYQQPSLAWA
jgi:CRP-like cAMP-binding protein